jgi:hypothetical protein
MGDGRVRISLLEDPELPQVVVQAAGVSAFVTDGFFEEYLAHPFPGLTAEIYERIQMGLSPLLTLSEIRQANSRQGLNLVMLHFVLRNPDLSDAYVQQVLSAMNAAFFFFYGGYHLRSVIQEVGNAEAARFMEAGGFRLVANFGPTDETSKSASNSEHYVLAIRKEQVQPSVVNPLSFMFQQIRPRIFFSPGEQKVLELALLNESDEEIAGHLGVSTDAVKKAWRRVYERAAFALPNLFGASGKGTTRGSEKRRHLLEYLRVHLEELRPALRHL